MHSTALPLTFPSLTSDHRQNLLKEKPLLSLYELFATLPDPRSKHGLRYELAFLLTCLVAALLCHCDSTLAVGQWCREQRCLLTQLFGPRRFLCPSASLYRKLLPRLDAEQIACALADWIRATCKLRRMIRSRLMARRCVALGQPSTMRLICSPSVPIRATRRCCTSRSPRKPLRSPSPRPCFLACLCLAGSVLPMPCIPRSTFTALSMPSVASAHEDRAALRSGHAPQIMAALRNLAITLIHRQGSSQIAATRHHFASHPRHLFVCCFPGDLPSNNSQALLAFAFARCTVTKMVL